MHDPDRPDPDHPDPSARLALDGGPPACPALPSWPRFADDEIAAVSAVLRSGRVNYWTGDQGRAFEREFADYCSTRHAVALANGTLALELALRVLDIGPGDEVIVPPKTFIATASAVVMCGARPVFADVEADSQCLDPAAVEAALGPATRAIIAVHLGGWPADMPALAALARRHGLYLIEDCAQAHGATLDGRRVGGLGDIAAFSFCQDKIISSGGEGGMLLTDDEQLWRRAWAFKDHGKDYATLFETAPEPDAVYRWVHQGFGSNWRLTESQSAIGRLQLAKLDDWLARRRANAAALVARLRRHPALYLPEPPPGIGHAYYRVYARVREDLLAPGWGRDRLLRAIIAEGVPCFYGSASEIYRERAFVDAGLAPASALPVAASLSATSLAFACHPSLSTDDMGCIGDAVDKVLAVATA